MKMRKYEIARRMDPKGFVAVTPSVFIHEVAADPPVVLSRRGTH